MISESELEQTEHGLVPKGEGWFVLNLRDAEWRHADGRGAVCVALDDFEGRRQPVQLGVNPFALGPGEPMAMYHWEADQEAFLVLSGEAFCSSKARNGGCARGTSCTARRRRST